MMMQGPPMAPWASGPPTPYSPAAPGAGSSQFGGWPSGAQQGMMSGQAPPNGSSVYPPAPPEHGFVERSRVVVKAPRPAYHGAAQFYGEVGKRYAVPDWGEICATQGPEAALFPVPQVPMKQWYNTYVYYPERPSHVENQFLERFVPGPDGEWIDVTKCRRMAQFYEEQKLKVMREESEQHMVMHDSVVKKTQFRDAYSGEPLVECRGELMPRRRLLQEYEVHSRAAEFRALLEEEEGNADWDNLRVPWPFGRPHRNKTISRHTYDWFDRRNPYIQRDESMQIIETASCYVDKEHHDRFLESSALDREPLPGQERVQYLDL